MGNTWAVEVWGEHFVPGEYCYMQVWQGESLFGALHALWKHRRAGGCIKLEYRPRLSQT